VGYLKGALIGLVGGVLLTVAVLAIEVAHAGRSVSAQMPECHTNALSDRTDFVCDSAMQVGGLELPVAFVVGFAAAIVWSTRRRRLA
jgi:hypothetical protein